jgi:Spy/CpxP family protein refolding chaperone
VLRRSYELAVLKLILSKANNFKGSIMKKTIAALVLGLGISSVAFAFGGGHHRGHFDWDELDLTDTQEDQVETIKDNYHDKFHALRKSEGAREDKRSEFFSLRQQMMIELKEVLTPEQQQEAQGLIFAKVEKRMNKRLDKLSWKLGLTDEQEANLKTRLEAKLVGIKARVEAGDIPKMADRESMLKEFDAQMQNMLSAEQLSEWNELKEKRIQHIAKHDSHKHRF